MKKIVTGACSYVKNLKKTFGIIVQEFGGDFERNGSYITGDVAHMQIFSRHRTLQPINDISPTISSSCHISPNATLVGDVHIKEYSQVGYNTVMRAELNAIRIENYVSIGNSCTFNTWYNTPEGVPSSIYIGDHSVIESGCVIGSCIIDEQVKIGARSVISEGVKIGKGAIIAPNSFIPPGKYIPEYQYWEGSPVKFVREVSELEVHQTYLTSYENYVNVDESNKEDKKTEEIRNEEVKEYLSENYFKWRTKYYDH